MYRSKFALTHPRIHEQGVTGMDLPSPEETATSNAPECLANLLFLWFLMLRNETFPLFAISPKCSPLGSWRIPAEISIVLTNHSAVFSTYSAFIFFIMQTWVGTNKSYIAFCHKSTVSYSKMGWLFFHQKSIQLQFNNIKKTFPTKVNFI